MRRPSTGSGQALVLGSLLLGLAVLPACRRYGVGLAPATPWRPGEVSLPLPEEAQGCLVACPTGTTCNRRTSQCDLLPTSAAPVLYGADAGAR